MTSNYIVFSTPPGFEVAIELEGLISCVTSKTPGCMILYLTGVDEPLEVIYSFDAFVKEFLDHVDCRVKKRSRSRKKKRDPVVLQLVKPTSPPQSSRKPPRLKPGS